MSTYRSKPPMRVLVDMDGVLADLVSIWLEAYNGVTGECLSPADITSYHWHELVRDTTVFYELLRDKPLFALARPFRNIGGFKALCENPAFDVHIISYVHRSAYRTGYAQKLEWLAEFCPHFDLDKVTFTRQKYIAAADVLVEDSPDNIDAWTAANPKGHAICIRAAYNENWRPKHSTRVTMADDITQAASAIFRSYGT